MGCDLSIEWRKVKIDMFFEEIRWSFARCSRLNEIYKNAFSQWNVDRQIGTKSAEQYPLLIAISRQSNGDYHFRYLINGPTDRPVIDEFLARLIQHKDQFEIGEDQLEQVRKEHYTHTRAYFDDFGSRKNIDYSNVHNCLVIHRIIKPIVRYRCIHKRPLNSHDF